MAAPPPQVVGVIRRAAQADFLLKGLEKHSTGASAPWPGLLSCSHCWLTAQVRGALWAELGDATPHFHASAPLLTLVSHLFSGATSQATVTQEASLSTSPGGMVTLTCGSNTEAVTTPNSADWVTPATVSERSLHIVPGFGLKTRPPSPSRGPI